MSTRKSVKQFVKEQREELDRVIQSQAPGSPKSDHERELWLRNDEKLYRWARSEGVRI
jgi:hypothetical protein